MLTIVPDSYPELVDELYLSLEPKTLPPPADFCPFAADVEAIFAEISDLP